MRNRLTFALLLLTALHACPVRANHGPGTSGGGTTTVSGETLKPGAWELSLRYDYTKFENISQAEARRRAVAAGEFDALSEAHIVSTSLSYGLLTDLQLSATLGWYDGNGFISAESEESGDTESSTADPDGLTDLWLNGKWRVVKGWPGNLAIVAGIKLPTGRDDVRLGNGQLLEPSSQPGTGAVDYQLGLSYSRFLTSAVTVDASFVYTFRTEHDGFEVGDRWDAGVALAYRLTESIGKFPNYSVFAEATVVSLRKDHSNVEGYNPNSGGVTLLLSPGARIRFNEHLGLSIAPAFPVIQDLNGDQVESRFRLTAVLSWSF